MIGNFYYMAFIQRWLFWNRLRRMDLMQRQSASMGGTGPSGFAPYREAT